MDSNACAKSVLDFTTELVRVPSQAGIDRLEPVIDLIGTWLSANDVNWESLQYGQETIAGILIRLESGRPGPIVCLDAPIDTAPVGRRDAWDFPPFGAVIHNGRMYGRGVADAKIAVSLFCHIARELGRSESLKRGALHVLLDGDEHTGNFGGVRAYVESLGMRPSFVAVGYPGNWGVKIGARGFYRAVLRVFGKEQHSGARASSAGQNAIVKMTHLIGILTDLQLPEEPDPDFAFGPKLSITHIAGGNGFSQIPGQCEANLDVRLTPGFSTEGARSLIRHALKRLDAEVPTGESSVLTEHSTWPAYRLEAKSPFVRTLVDAATKAFGKDIHTVVVGPSNIGNYLASFQIPATCGFGVSYDNQHAADEYVEVETVAPVFETYNRAVLEWCGDGRNSFAIPSRADSK